LILTILIIFGLNLSSPSFFTPKGWLRFMTPVKINGSGNRKPDGKDGPAHDKDCPMFEIWP